MKLSKKKKIIGASLLGTGAIITALYAIKKNKKINYKKINEIPKVELDKFITHCRITLTKECFKKINDNNDNKLNIEDLNEYFKFINNYNGNLYDLLKINTPFFIPHPPSVNEKSNGIFQRRKFK